jgi:hypothetical protein
MKKEILILTIVSLMIFRCNKNNCNPEITIPTWYEGKEIVVTYDSIYQRNEYNIEDGVNILFEYNHAGQQCDDVYDDEWGEILTFEIDKKIIDFEFVDSNIITTKCFYQEYGAWVRHNRYQIKDGIIKGKKISEDKWEITVSVSTTPIFSNETPQAIKFKQIFNK